MLCFLNRAARVVSAFKVMCSELLHWVCSPLEPGAERWEDKGWEMAFPAGNVRPVAQLRGGAAQQGWEVGASPSPDALGYGARLWGRHCNIPTAPAPECPFFTPFGCTIPSFLLLDYLTVYPGSCFWTHWGLKRKEKKIPSISPPVACSNQTRAALWVHLLLPSDLTANAEQSGPGVWLQ